MDRIKVLDRVSFHDEFDQRTEGLVTSIRRDYRNNITGYVVVACGAAVLKLPREIAREGP